MEAMLGAQRLWERLGGWARRSAAAVLSSAHRPVPRHIAFIMDGNRRYAEARQLRKVEGHAYGYQRLIDALEWCLELGVSCVSVYAFSIDNYRRSGEEVSTLMELAEEKLAHMLQVRGVRGSSSSRSATSSVSCSSSSRGKANESEEGQVAGCQQPTMLNSPAPPLLTAFTACCSRSRCHCCRSTMFWCGTGCRSG
jgi:undecaprenyl pyrophosphate synthase